MAEFKLCMKLLINIQTKKVLFAEAGKECVDFLFHILSLPLATVIRLLQEQGMVGCLSNLYESVENLNETYIQPGKNKDELLKPIVTTSVPMFLLRGDAKEETEKSLYKCCQETRKRQFGGSHPKSLCEGLYYSEDERAICPGCNRQMTTCMIHVAPPQDQVVKKVFVEDGFVEGVVTYMVMDDLIIKPMSTISSLTLLNKFNVKDITALKEKEVQVGLEEAVKLLKTCFHSKQVLTEVFLNNNS